jgi:hypothetical protein
MPPQNEYNEFKSGSEINILDGDAPATLPDSFNFATPETLPAGQWASLPFLCGPHATVNFRFKATFGTANYIEYAIETSNDNRATWTQVMEEVATSATTPPATPSNVIALRRRIQVADHDIDGVGGSYRIQITISVPDVHEVRLRLRADAASQAAISECVALGGGGI